MKSEPDIYDAVSELREQESKIKKQIQEIEAQRWDKELVGKYFKVSADPDSAKYPFPIVGRNYINVTKSPITDKFSDSYVYNQWRYFHVRERRGSALLISGFTSGVGHHADWGGEMLELSTADYSLEDFTRRGQFDGTLYTEITKEQYNDALLDVIKWFQDKMLAEC